MKTMKVKVIVLILVSLLFLSACTDKNNIPNYTNESYIKLNQDESRLITKNNWPGSPLIFLKYINNIEGNYEVAYGDPQV